MSWLDGPLPDDQDDLDALDGKSAGDSSDPREKMDLPPEIAGAVALIAQMGRTLKASQQALIDSGFTDDQAFQIMMHFVTNPSQES